MLRSYLEEINAAHNIMKYANYEIDMMPRSLQLSLIDIVIKYMIDLFGDYPSRDQKVMIAKAVINVFPSLKFKDSQIGGYVCNFLYKFSCMLYYISKKNKSNKSCRTWSTIPKLAV